MDEFQLIRNFFQRDYNDQQIIFGSGDDAACLQPKPNYLLCVSTDTFVEGVHFLSEWDPSVIAAKLVTVNISDIAAMAAVPKWVSVAMTIPTVNQAWLNSFSKGLFYALDTDNIALIGGDLTRGPLSFTITIHGQCLPEEVTYRHGANPGDTIYVTGLLGAPALAVDWLDRESVDYNAKNHVMEKLLKPRARTDCQQLISQFASSCIDISDGLVGDLGHICQQSYVGANLVAEQIPIDRVVKDQVPEKALSYALHGGDEYQLCFTVADDKKYEAEAFAKQSGLSIYPIGQIIHEQTLNLLKNGKLSSLKSKSYRHFL